eukprot:5942879-Prymnesium_polylepis.1
MPSRCATARACWTRPHTAAPWPEVRTPSDPKTATGPPTCHAAIWAARSHIMDGFSLSIFAGVSITVATASPKYAPNMWLRWVAAAAARVSHFGCELHVSKRCTNTCTNTCARSVCVCVCVRGGRSHIDIVPPASATSSSRISRSCLFAQ